MQTAGGSDQMPPPLPLPRVKVGDAEAPACGARSGARSSDEYFVDRLIALAGAPGQLRAEALGLLTRIGRSYPAHLSGGGGTATGTGTGSGSGSGAGAPKTTWERVSALLLRCFADPDQNLRLHALKVLEALLLARAEQAAVAVAAAAGTKAKAAAIAAAPAAENMSPRRPPRSRIEEKKAQSEGGASAGRVLEEGREGGPPSQQAKVSGGGDGPGVAGRGAGMAAEGDDGGKLWEDLVQKHLQRALEDPYHGVRAVACSCHACLLGSDWEAFSDRERDRCLDRVLAATRDRAAGRWGCGGGCGFRGS